MDTNYFVQAWLQGRAEPFGFQVAEAAFGRFKKAFTEKRTGFLIFATICGGTYALNLKYLQTARFYTKLTELEPKVVEDLSPRINLYFLERKSLKFKAQDPRELARIFMKVKPAQDRESLMFTDVQNEEVHFFTTDLILLETATQFVEEGFLAIHLANQAAKLKDQG